MTWSPQQDQALKLIRAWLKGGKKTPQVFKLYGFAGTGKTTLAREVEQMTTRVLYGTFTGKAALVMRSKGCLDASTLHSLIYKVEEDKHGKPQFIKNYDSQLRGAGVLVLDEASMVGEELGSDVLSFGTKVLVLGDPFQLPPVKDAGFFTIGQPDYMLTEIHRQAADNPIIRMSMDIREGRGLGFGTYGESRVIARAGLAQRHVLEADQVLCGLNRSRRSFNDKIRRLKGRDAQIPVEDDKLVCLRNNKEKGLLNGGLWTAVESPKLKDGVITMNVRPEGTTRDDVTEVDVPIEFFQGREESLPYHTRRLFDEFDYGYALTVHKSQGSAWPNVVLFNESAAFREDAPRWLYTGVTRAADRVTVVQ